jgi:hypothetical protein
MKMTSTVLIGFWILCTCGCGANPDPDPAPFVAVEPAARDAVPTILDRPFTAEQIRDEWIEGFELEVRRWTPAVEVFERWTVVRADDEGVDIRSEVVGDDGSPLRKSTVQTSSWVQLRNHATFPADRATREAVSRETPLGELHGWLYTVTEPATGLVTEFFFADGLPGAPAFVHVLRDGEVVEIFEQIERVRP